MKLADAFASPEQKRRYNHRLFTTIADRYDLITVLLSFGRDRAWKQKLIDAARLRPGERVLDVACGTGDLAFAAATEGAAVTGLDLTFRMIEIATEKAGRQAPGSSPPGLRFLVGDMSALPFSSQTFDVITTGYGLRNVPQLEQSIGEIARLLRPQGRFLSLDFNRPRGQLVRALYLAYLSGVGSMLGWLLHRDPDTYRYIAESLRRYPSADGVARLLQQHGFDAVRVVPLLGGLMTLHVARRETPMTLMTGETQIA